MGKGKKGGKRMNKAQLTEMLQEFFAERPGETLSFKEIFRSLHLTTHPLKMLAIDIMEEMAWDDYLAKVSDNSYRLNQSIQVMEGKFVRKANGKNSVIPDDSEKPIFVSERNSMGALNGDRVEFTFLARRKNHIKEAQVNKILERAKDTFVGRLKVDKDLAYLVTPGDVFAHNIIIPRRKVKGGKTDDKAVVRIIEWPDGENKSPIGEVVDILGQMGDNDVEMNSILAQYGLPYKYPKNVEDAANKISGEITEQDYKEREDFRKVFTCTIDPKDAKDFDDALSIQRLENGNWQVGVHIADVSHYVTEGSIIDKEAVKRATSVYLVDRTIPMLPERLCNFICSLRVRIIEWPDGENKSPIGEVVDILGQMGDNDVEMNSILAQYGLPYKYPKNVEDAANKISGEITEQDYKEREDFRKVFTCTIDPKDAKDFDDALSIQRLENGNWQVGVHIADVSHYVTEGSIIDKEAVKRATSVYLVDRTIPMLPERLCNFICSLRPNEEKLAYSVIFELDNNAEVKNYRIVHTVIESDRRYKYEEVQELLEANGVVDGTGEPAPAETKEHPYQGENALQLITLDRLAKKLRAARFKNGSVKFDREELHFDIDEKGKPVSCYYKRSKDANKLVEEFMLLANRTVAESIGKVKKGKKPKTLPYRIHDNPDPQKLETLREFVVKFGYKMKTEGTKGATARSLNKLMSDCEGKPENNLIQMVALRAMMKAKYSVHNIGHFGLAFEYYTHFTSPIRRYPDTMVHRLLTKYADGGRSANEKHYEELCEHCSEMEQIAQNAERDSIKYKMVEFMGDKLGEEFDAHISGITSYGIYATIDENHCEGMIPMRDIADDYYDFDEKNFCLIGRRHHNKYQLGDAIRIKVAQANLEKKQLDFTLAGDSAPVRKEKPAANTSSSKAKKSKQKTRNHRKNK